jgi:urocanate hydratase
MVESAVEPDVTAIAAPIGPPGQAVAVLSLLVPSYRAEPAKTAAYGQAVAAAALALSGELTGPVSRFGCV